MRNDRSNRAILAKKYAQAFIRSLPCTLSENDYQAIKSAITSINKQILFFLQLTVIKNDIKKNALDLICERFKLSKYFNKMCMLLLKHNRTFLICEILNQICILYNIQNNIIEFTLYSSHELEDTQKESLQNFLKRSTLSTIIYHHKINTQLIAGIRMQSATLLWEYSVQKQLRELQLLV